MAKIYRVDPMVQTVATNKTRDFKQLQSMYDSFTASPGFQQEFPNYGTIPMKPGFGGRSAAFWRGKERWIRIGGNGCEAVVLHEIAHHVNALHRDRYGPKDCHGPGFAAAFLDVVTLYQGERGRIALTAAFAQERIKVWREGGAVLLPMPEELPEAVRDVLADMTVLAETRKARAARQRKRRAEEREALERDMQRWADWKKEDYAWERLSRKMAAHKAWATRRARAAANA